MATKSKYNVTSAFKLGYRAKEDVTNLPPGVLVAGSQNVTLNDGERVATRLGYTLDGQANVTLFPIVSSYDWQTHLGTERHLRSYDDELEYRYVDSSGVVTWRRLADGFSSTAFNYAEFWNTTEVIDELLLVNGTANIYAWSGAITTFASAAAGPNTITKQGVTTWAEEGFYTAGARTVVINGTTYTYTGGTSTTTLTGVAPDPTLAGHAVGSVIHQGLRTTTNVSMTGLALLHNDLISVLYNQVYVGSFTDRSVYVSQINSYINYSFSSPRLVGEGAILTLDGTPIGFIPQEEYMYISAGKDFWYKTDFQLSADNTAQRLSILKLKTNPQAATQSQAFISKIKNDVIFVSNEPTLDTLGRLELIQTPQSTNISDPIKRDFDLYDFDGGSCFYYQNYIYVAIPTQGVVRVYNLVEKFWEAPMTLPISRFAIIDGLLYGHSSQVPETYKMFTGTNDNGLPINHRAVFSYQNGGNRAELKVADEFYTEGYITPNSIITQTQRFDYEGSTGIKTFTIDGSDSTIIFNLTGDGSLGKQNLGNVNLGGRGDTEDALLPPKFRAIKTASELDYYEIQTEYSSNAIDQYWEILAFGSSEAMSTSNNASITQ